MAWTIQPKQMHKENLSTNISTFLRQILDEVVDYKMDFQFDRIKYLIHSTNGSQHH